MKKTFFSLIAKSLLIAMITLASQTSFAQTTLFTFPFENNTTPSVDNVIGSPTFLNSIQTSVFSTATACQGSRMLIQNNWAANDFLQFTVNTIGYTNMTLSFCNRSGAQSVGAFQVLVSANGGNTWTIVQANFTPTNTNATVNTSTFPVAANNNSEVLIQVLKVTAANASRDYYFDNAILSGTPMPGIDTISAASACAGSTFNITGINFTAITAVQVNNVNVASYVVNSATSITATLAATNTSGAVKVTNASGTATSATSLTINPKPTAVTATASSSNICIGNTINLSASATSNSDVQNVTVFSENFNSATNSWTTTNTSTSGNTPANAAWTLRPNGYNVSSETFNSNDNSQFYMSNSDAQGTTGNPITNTTLTSPAFSTIGLANASLTFYHYFRNVSTDSGRVFVSTNGTTWTQLTIYSNNASGGTGTVGASNAFNLATISLNAYLNQATVYIRFQYQATFDWYWAIDNINVSGLSTTAPPTYTWTSTPTGFTSMLQNPTAVAPTVNTIYTVTATNSFGCATSASTVVVAVSPAALAGTVSANQTICSGTQPSNITIGTSTGTIQWQSSTDNSTFNNIVGQTTNTLSAATIGTLIATRYYRAVVTSGVCASVNSAVVTISVNPTSLAGTVSANQTICSGTQPSNITIGTSTGTIQWQSSTDNSTFNNIVGQTTNTLSGATIGTLIATRYYRAVVTSGVCASVNSAVVTVSVNPTPVAGIVSANQTICSGLQPANITIGTSTGTIQWQSSTNNSTFNNIVGQTTNTLAGVTIGNLTATAYYRAVITSGVCASINSAVVTVTVDAAANGGTLTPNPATVCYANNSGTLTLSGFSGTIIGWEYSLNNFATAGIPIANTTNTLDYTNLLAPTYFRAVLSGGSCGTVNSDVAAIAIDYNTIWTGAVSNSWHDAGNWSCGIIPTSDVNVTIVATTNQPEISQDAFANTITLDPTATLLLKSDSDLRVVNAILGLTNAKLTIENNANLIQENDLDNTVIANITRVSNPLMRLDYTLWSSPVDNQNLLAFSSGTLPNRFYVYNPSNDLYSTIAPATNDFAEGKGYLIRMPDLHPTTPTTWNGIFEGTLHNGTVNIPVAANSYNAIGNPYPSTLDADQFITQNGITEALYFWRKTNNSATTSYATYTLAGGAGTQSNNLSDPLSLTPNGTIQVGQGFIAKSTATALSFNNTMRIGNNANQFFRSEIERNRIWLNLTNTAGIFSQTMVAYMTGATMGLDAAIDGKYFNDSQLALTSIIDNVAYAVQGRSLPFENTDTVPLGFKAVTAGNYTIAIDATDGLFANTSQDIFLKDNLANTTHDLRSGGYTFASEAGAFNTRFELVYQMTLATTNPTFDANQVVVYQQENNIVINSGKTTMAKVQLFDVRGRLIAEKANINATEATLFAGTTNQVIVVKITTKEGQVVSKKVVN